MMEQFEAETQAVLADPEKAAALRDAVTEDPPTPFEEVPTLDEVQRLPEFNPLQTWAAMVAEYGDPLVDHGIPETEKDW